MTSIGSTETLKIVCYLSADRVFPAAIGGLCRWPETIRRIWCLEQYNEKAHSRFLLSYFDYSGCFG